MFWDSLGKVYIEMKNKQKNKTTPSGWPVNQTLLTYHYSNLPDKKILVISVVPAPS